MKPVTVFGGYGVFGERVCRELARLGASVVVAGRDLAKGEALARELGAGARAIAADVRDRASCARVLEGAGAGVSCAGPFSITGPAFLEACLESGCHALDIADDRGYAALVRGRGERFRERDLAAVYGCSSLPGISGALALLSLEGETRKPIRVRVTLFIGNDNKKGDAAVRSAVEQLGRPIQTARGTIKGFRDREVVPLPPPFGKRAVYNFESPDHDLFPGLLGVESVSVKVGFELRAATLFFATLARLGSHFGEKTASLLVKLSSLAPGIGCSGGAVMAELFFEDGSSKRASLSSDRDGQRMAALPAAIAAHALLEGRATKRGALTAYELLGAKELVAEVEARGFQLAIDQPPPRPSPSSRGRV